MDIAEAVRPVLPQDTVYLNAKEGLVLRRGDQRILVKGSSIAERFDKLAPLLSGERTLAEVLGMDSEEEAGRSGLGRLLLQLIERRFVLKRTEADRSALPASERERWRDIIAFLGHYVDNPVTAFRDFRAGRILLVGQGCLHRSFVRSLAFNGIRELHVGRIETAGEQADGDDIEAAMAGIGATDVVVTRIADARPDFSSFDAVCYAADLPDLNAVNELSRSCRALGTPLFTGTVLGDSPRIGPLDACGNPCWNCMLLRLGDSLPTKEAELLWRRFARRDVAFRGSTRPCSIPSLRVAGNALALRVFRFLAGMPGSDPDSPDRVETISSLTLESRSAVLLPHPACECWRDAATFRPAKEVDRTTLPPPTLAHAQRVLFDHDVGVFAGFDDDQLSQAPVFRSRVMMHSRLEGGLRRPVAGNSLLSNEHAREDALLDAARWYTKVLYERDGWGLIPEALPLAEDRRRHGVHGSLPAAAGAIARDATRTMAVHAEGGGRCLRIAAGELLPIDIRGGFSSDRWFSGIACGLSAAQARTKARASLVGDVAARAAARGALSFAKVEDWSALLAPHFALLRSIDLVAAIGLANVDDVWIACEPGNAGADAVMTASETREECVAQCLAEALAVRSGGSSERTFRGWLPDLHEFDGRQPKVLAEPETTTSLVALLMLDPFTTAISGLVDLTPTDLRLVGLHVWKAVCLTRPH